jgi:hypothetical protein
MFRICNFEHDIQDFEHLLREWGRTILMVFLRPPFQTILLNKQLILLRIGPLAMMLLLVGNVMSNTSDISAKLKMLRNLHPTQIYLE